MKKIIYFFAFLYIFIFLIFNFISFNFINKSLISKIDESFEVQNKDKIKFYFNSVIFNFSTNEEIILKKDLFEIKIKDLRVNPILKDIKIRDFKIYYKGEEDEFENFFIFEKIGNFLQSVDYNLFLKNGFFKDLQINSLDIFMEEKPKIKFNGDVKDNNFEIDAVFVKNEKTNIYKIEDIKIKNKLIQILYKKLNQYQYAFNASTVNIKKFLNIFDLDLDLDLKANLDSIIEADKEKGNGKITIGENKDNNIRLEFSTKNENKDSHNLILNLEGDFINLENKEYSEVNEEQKIKNKEYSFSNFKNFLKYITSKLDIQLNLNIEELKTKETKMKNINLILETKKEEFNIKKFNVLAENKYIFDVNNNEFLFNIDSLELFSSFIENKFKFKINSKINNIKGKGFIKNDILNLEVYNSNIFFNDLPVKINKFSSKKTNIEIKDINIDDIFVLDIIQDKELKTKKSIIQKLKEIDKNLEDFDFSLNISNSSFEDVKIENLDLNISNEINDNIKINFTSNTSILKGDFDFKFAKDFMKIIPEGKFSLKSRLDYLDNIKVNELLINKFNNVNFLTLEGLEGSFDIEIKNLKNRLDLNLLDLKGNLKSSVIELDIQNFDKSIKINSKINITDDMILKFNTGFSISNIEIKDISLCKFPQGNLKGFLSFNGNILSQGSSFKELDDNLEASGSFIVQNFSVKDFDLVSVGYALLYRNNIDLDKIIKTNKGVIENIRGNYKFKDNMLFGDYYSSQEVISSNGNYKINLSNNNFDMSTSIIIGTRERYSGKQVNLNLFLDIQNAACNLDKEDYSNYKFNKKELVDFISNINNRK